MAGVQADRPGAYADEREEARMTLTELRAMHSELAALVERFGRALTEAESKNAARVVAPTQIEYDHNQLDEPPKPIVPMCKHDESAVLKTLTSKKTGSPYDVWVCGRPRDEQCEMWQFPERL
jgi:hypothetical protein